MYCLNTDLHTTLSFRDSHFVQLSLHLPYGACATETHHDAVITGCSLKQVDQIINKLIPIYLYLFSLFDNKMYLSIYFSSNALRFAIVKQIELIIFMHVEICKIFICIFFILSSK